MTAPDPLAASEALLAYLACSSPESRANLELCNVSCQLADDFRSLLPDLPGELRAVCEMGAAWVLGRRSTAASNDTWSAVVTGPDLDPRIFQRLTAETLISLIISADKTLRIFSPFVDIGGIEPLQHVIAVATKRSVATFVGYRSTPVATSAVQSLYTAVSASGDIAYFRIVPIPSERSFPHLKLLLVDGKRGYIGSANLTRAALTTNYEVGALVEGRDVQVFEKLLDTAFELPSHHLAERGGDPGRRTSGGR